MKTFAEKRKKNNATVNPVPDYTGGDPNVKRDNESRKLKFINL